MSFSLRSDSSKQLPKPEVPGGTPGVWNSFSTLEWNVLTNRARSLLKALEECEAASQGIPCKACPMAGIPSEGGLGYRTAACRSSFRHLEQRLARLANLAPEPDRQQLHRTLDSLHLAYRQLDREG